MARVFWLALLSGYIAGLAWAVLALPDPIVEPLYGGMAIGSVIVVAGIALAMRFSTGPLALATADGPAAGADAGGDLAGADKQSGPTPADADAARERPADAGQRTDLAPDPIDRLISVEALHHLLDRNRLDVVLTPVVALPEGPFEDYQAASLLRADDGHRLEPRHYLSVAARTGHIVRIERLLLGRCTRLLGDALDEGRDVRVFAPVSSTSLDAPGFTAELGRFLQHYPELASRLIVTVDRLRLHRAAGAELAALSEAGLKLCLRRLSLDGLEPTALEQAGFAFVRLDLPEIAVQGQRDRLPRRLRTAQKALEKRGITLVLDRRDAESLATGPADDPGLFTEHPGFRETRPSAA